jgi:hypothetical protein
MRNAMIERVPRRDGAEDDEQYRSDGNQTLFTAGKNQTGVSKLTPAWKKSGRGGTDHERVIGPWRNNELRGRRPPLSRGERHLDACLDV